MTRAEVLDAIRAGATTTAAITRRLKADSKEVSHTLYALRLIGRVITSPGPMREGKPGVPGFRYEINWNWQPRNAVCPPEKRKKLSVAGKARAAKNPESEARRIAKVRATWAAKKVQIPSWVKPSHRRTYRAIARVLGEETAAEWARKAKAKDDPWSRPRSSNPARCVSIAGSPAAGLAP